jgi:hypothetical protein
MFILISSSSFDRGNAARSARYVGIMPATLARHQ